MELQELEVPQVDPGCCSGSRLLDMTFDTSYQCNQVRSLPWTHVLKLGKVSSSGDQSTVKVCSMASFKSISAISQHVGTEWLVLSARVKEGRMWFSPNDS